MEGMTNFDETVRKTSLVANTTRFDLDALTERTKEFTLQKDFEAFKQRTLDKEAEMQKCTERILQRVTDLESLFPKVCAFEGHLHEHIL